MLLNLNDFIYHAQQNLYAVPAFSISDATQMQFITKLSQSSIMPVVINVPAGNNAASPELCTKLKAFADIAETSFNPIAISVKCPENTSALADIFKNGCTSCYVDSEILHSINKEDPEAALLEISYTVHSSNSTLEVSEELIVSLLNSKGLEVSVKNIKYYTEKFDIDMLSIITTLSLENSPVDKPILSLDHIVEMRQALSIPLSCHTPDGYSEFDLIHAVGNGICKIDLESGTSILKGSVLEKNPEYIKLNDISEESAADIAEIYRILSNR